MENNDIQKQTLDNVNIQQQLDSLDLLNISEDIFADWDHDVQDNTQNDDQIQQQVDSLDLLNISDDLFNNWSDREDDVCGDNKEKLSLELQANQPEENHAIHSIPHLNECIPSEELQHLWFMCRDENELTLKCFILHFIGSFGNEGVRLQTIRGRKV